MLANTKHALQGTLLLHFDALHRAQSTTITWSLLFNDAHTHKLTLWKSIRKHTRETFYVYKYTNTRLHSSSSSFRRTVNKCTYDASILHSWLIYLLLSSRSLFLSLSYTIKFSTSKKRQNGANASSSARCSKELTASEEHLQKLHHHHLPSWLESCLGNFDLSLFEYTLYTRYIHKLTKVCSVVVLLCTRLFIVCVCLNCITLNLNYDLRNILMCAQMKIVHCCWSNDFFLSSACSQIFAFDVNRIRTQQQQIVLQ